VVAIASVGNNDIETLTGITLLEQIFDLIDPNGDRIAGRCHTLDRDRQHPTRLGLGVPGEDRVAVADDDAGAVDVRCGAVDIAPILNRGGIWARPGGLVQGKDFNAALPRVVGYQAGEVAREPGGVLQPLVQGSIGRVPESSKDRLQGQLWERTYRRCQQQGIEEFLLGVASAGKAVLVDGLTEVLESVKLFHGEHLVGWPYQFLPWGGHAQDADRLFCSPTLV